MNKGALILGIETSCDESAVAILRCSADGNSEVLLELVSSQTELHALYGGVVPELASREHMRNLPLLVDKGLSDAKLSLRDIGAIGVTVGPGLKGCLLIGALFAQGLALPGKIPLYGINHIEGHVLSVVLDNPGLSFPYLALVVSGGHTEIQIVRAVGQYELVARTTDDAAGEAFDKSANLMGFEYPGGAKLAALADTVASSDLKLPKVMREAPGFSFSGLKTAIANLVRHNHEILEQAEFRASLAFAIQDAIVDALLFKLAQAVKDTGIRKIAVCGGVSANKYLQAKLKAKYDQVYLAKSAHCVDNAAMIAFAAQSRRAAGLLPLANPLQIRPRWPLESV